jgi:dynein heavy chain, axonemal
MSRCPSVVQVDWMRVDARPLRQSLSSLILQCIGCYTDHLSTSLKSTIAELCAFVELSFGVLHDTTLSATEEGLMEIMRVARAVKRRAERTEKLFEPMRSCAELLHRQGCGISDELSRALDDLPTRWSNLQKLTVQMKERLGAHLKVVADKIRMRSSQLDKTVGEFRANFKQLPEFTSGFGLSSAYGAIDEQQRLIADLDGEASAVKELEDLFESPVTPFAALVELRAELVGLKQLWDLSDMITNQFNVWERTPWALADTDAWMETARTFLRDVRGLPKVVKAWAAFGHVESSVQTMLAMLPLAQSLKSPALRERHWRQLMRNTGVSIKFDITSLKLGDIFALNLHRYGEEVANIVDAAQRELAIELNLAKMAAAWAQLRLTFERHEGTNCALVTAVELIVETLEDHQNLGQMMAASRFVAHFADDVAKWQKRLAAVDAALSQLVKVQKKWVSLESIFVGCADIRVQLKEDAERFDILDDDFKAIMSKISTKALAIDALMIDNLQEALDKVAAALERCEKALSNYLESIRRIFPRFYFVSPSDLVDIISFRSINRSNVKRHVVKSIDSIGDLKFIGIPLPFFSYCLSGSQSSVQI